MLLLKFSWQTPHFRTAGEILKQSKIYVVTLIWHLCLAGERTSNGSVL